jgi:hypothetical protein
MQEQNTIIQRLLSLFQGILRVFLFLNGIMVGIAMINIFQSPGSHFRIYFWMFFFIILQFWTMTLLYFFISVSIRVSLYIISSSINGDNPLELVQTIFAFPLRQDGEEDIVFQMITNESLHDTSPRRVAPTMDRLLKMELDWGSHILSVDQSTYAQSEEKCLICLHDMNHLFPRIPGVIQLSCACNTLFHKKCILEWFHFNAKESEQTDAYQVTCPSCRHVFLENTLTT